MITFETVTSINDALSALFIESIKELKAEVLELKRQLSDI